MKSVKVTPYTPPELEIITIETNDILAASNIVPTPNPGPSYGHEDDSNIDNDW